LGEAIGTAWASTGEHARLDVGWGVFRGPRHRVARSSRFRMCAGHRSARRVVAAPVRSPTVLQRGKATAHISRICRSMAMAGTGPTSARNGGHLRTVRRPAL